MNKNKRKVPEMRFPGFTDDWEQRKLGELGSTFNGLSGKTKEDFGHGKAQFVTYMNVYSNPIADLKMTEHVEIDNKQNEVQYGDIFFTTSSETPDEVGMSSVWLGNTPNTYLNSFCFGYRPKEKVNPYYMAYMLRSDTVRADLFVLAQGISRYNISKTKVMDIKVALPNFTEQEKIGKYFLHIDTLITLQENKLNELKALKKGCLQKMFPKKGEKVPEMRFPGFTDDWEQRKLGELGSTFNGLSGKTKEDFGHGKAQFVTYMNVYSNPIADLKMTEHVEIDNKQNEVQYGDIFFTTSSETPDEVGMSSVWLGNTPNTYLNSFCFGYRPKEKVNPYYMAYMLRSDTVRADLFVLAQGISRYNISKTKVMDIKVALPNFTEQEKIGKYFLHIDTLITLQENKLNELKALKKGCLQKMFV